MNPNVKTEPRLATTVPAVCRGPIEPCPAGTCARCLPEIYLRVENWAGGWRFGWTMPGDLHPWEWSVPYATEDEARIAARA